MYELFVNLSAVAHVIRQLKVSLDKENQFFLNNPFKMYEI